MVFEGLSHGFEGFEAGFAGVRVGFRGFGIKGLGSRFMVGCGSHLGVQL